MARKRARVSAKVKQRRVIDSAFRMPLFFNEDNALSGEEAADGLLVRAARISALLNRRAKTYRDLLLVIVSHAALPGRRGPAYRDLVFYGKGSSTRCPYAAFAVANVWSTNSGGKAASCACEAPQAHVCLLSLRVVLFLNPHLFPSASSYARAPVSQRRFSFFQETCLRAILSIVLSPSFTRMHVPRSDRPQPCPHRPPQFGHLA